MKTRTSLIMGTIGVIAAIGIFYFVVIDQSIDEFNKNFNVPENDPYCNTEFVVKTKEKTDRKLFEIIVRDEIAKFGEIYDMPDRYVLLTNLGDNRIRISLDGAWTIDSDRPNLMESITDLEFVESAEKLHGVYMVLSCQ